MQPGAGLRLKLGNGVAQLRLKGKGVTQQAFIPVAQDQAYIQARAKATTFGDHHLASHPPGRNAVAAQAIPQYHLYQLAANAVVRVVLDGCVRGTAVISRGF